MATLNKFGWISAIVVISTCLPTTVEGQNIVTTRPVPAFTTTDSSKDQLLLSASPNFTADLSTFDTFTAQVHSLLGAMFQPLGPGNVDFEHQEDNGFPDMIHGDIALPYAMVGRNANGENGTVLYKFVVESGFQTAAGGTIGADVYFRHDPLDGNQGFNAWIGVNSTASIPATLSELSNDVDFQRVNMRDHFGPDSSGFASYTGEVSLGIPAGLTEFYVAFSDVFSGGANEGNGTTHSSGRFAFPRLEIQAVLEESPALPGDYNNNGKLDAADYTMWRDNLGSATSLPNDDTPGVEQDDYTRWKNNFGNTSGGGAVPEPCSILLAVSGVGVLVLLRSKQAHIFHLH